MARFIFNLVTGLFKNIWGKAFLALSTLGLAWLGYRESLTWIEIVWWTLGATAVVLVLGGFLIMLWDAVAKRVRAFLSIDGLQGPNGELRLRITNHGSERAEEVRLQVTSLVGADPARTHDFAAQFVSHQLVSSRERPDTLNPGQSNEFKLCGRYEDEFLWFSADPAVYSDGLCYSPIDTYTIELEATAKEAIPCRARFRIVLVNDDLAISRL